MEYETTRSTLFGGLPSALVRNKILVHIGSYFGFLRVIGFSRLVFNLCRYRTRVWMWVTGQPGVREASICDELLIPGCPVTDVRTLVA